MYQTKLGKMMISFIMVLAMVFQLASPILTMAATSDRDTSTKYTESLGDNVSTEYAGRVWTDKSVFTTDVTFDTYGGGNVTVELEPEQDEDFLISYSALATSESISGQSQAPVDVVLILDISGSMSNGDSNMDNGRSRIYNTVQAANAAIDELMRLNTHTRVSVVVFSSNAQVLLPLGRYSKVGSYNYLSVNRQTASNSYADLTVRANNGRENINETVDVEGGTNIQMGLYEGMKVLADEESTTVNINGQTLQRVPSVILLSDGSPTYSSNSSSWWAPQDNYNDGPGNRAYAGNGFKAILVGAYMKAAIDRNYGVAGTSYATTVYTVGMGITGLSDSEKNLANMTLNPGYYWNNDRVSNTMKTTIKNYWSGYTARNNTGTLDINVGRAVSNGWSTSYYDKDYRLTHPTTGYDVDPTNGYDYVDDYYSADNASAVTDVFEQIVSSISISAPQVPTEIKGDDPLTDGYITYTDPIGKYMEVKDVKSIIYAGTEFTQKSKTTENGVTTYTFSGEVHSPVYGDQNIRNILITVEENADGDQTLVIKIPASVIPLRVNSVVLNPDGSVKSHTNNGAFPTRVIYSVGLQEGIKQISDDGHEYVDATKLSEAYMLANVNADGSINFYSNVFSNTNTVHGYSAGDATVEFEPSHTNPFYYIQQDMPIYKDREFKQPVPNSEELDADTVYYYKEEFYNGNSVEVLAIARTGAQLTKTAITKGTDGYQYRAAGSPRLNRILEFEGTKVENATGTAEDFYAPSFVYAEGSSDPFEGKFVIYHGNNGVLSMQTGGNLEIRKEVAAAAGLTAPGETFTFKVDLDGEKINGGSYIYVIRDAQQNEVSRGTVSAANDTISLQDGQIATIYSLPPHTAFEITEAPVDGFASESQGATGEIHAGQTQQAVFTNTYSVQPVTSQVLQGKKVFNGREWEAGDSFTFFLAPYNNCPLPVGYDADEGITVSAPDATGGHEAAFTFGAIEFTAPGYYRYTVFEKEPENDGYLPGVTYSRALYRIAILVEDNGDGTLKITSSDIQKLYDDDANQLFTYGSSNEIVMNSGEEAQDEMVFTNTYSASSVIRVPTALKVYSDPSGTKPLVSGMFQFQLKALGYAVDGGELQTDITKVPMPAGSVDGVAVTTNEGHNITFPHVEFTQSLIPDDAEYIAFRYELSEVIPQNPVPGMTYDETTFTVDVKVEIDHTADELKVSAIYPDDQYTAIFENSFKLQPVTADINGTKTLNGRDMLAGESFEFTLVGANAATNNAVRDGVVNVPSAVAVSGGKNGKAKAFSFQNIEFTKPGTYTFLVSETAGSAPAMFYDSSNISVTFVIADKDGDAKLEVVSTTYSNGKKSADFVNTYASSFNDTPVSLSGVKNLTGKSLLDGEFFFNVQELYNGDEIIERLVGHTGDDTPSGGAYTGQMVFLDNVTYTKPGTYTYIITEQIPDAAHKVKGTYYDESKYRFTVEVEDDGQGNLVIGSKTLQKAEGNGWTNAQRIEFNNRYVPEATTLELPLIKKVVSGDRNKALEENEFTFEMTTAEEDGIVLPTQTVVGNLANGDIVFGAITFTKAGEYTVTIREVIPADADKVPGITYTTKAVTAVFHVVDNRNGQLTATLAQLDRDTFINEYAPEPTAATISGRKELVGGTPEEDQFRFQLYKTASDYSIQGLTPLATLGNAADGSFRFDGTNVPELNYTAADTYYYVLVEDGSNPIAGIRYDTTQYRFAVTVSDNGDGTLKVDTVCVNGDAQNIIFRNVRHEEIVKKDVFAVTAPSVSVDGQKVNPGQVLEYTIRYKNYTGQTATVTITDTIPAGTEFISAENGGVLEGNRVKWTVANIAADAEITVRFRVKVSELAQSVENTATVLEGNNTYTTNEVTTETVEDKVEKTVVAPSQPDVSIDGQKVAVGQTLVYKITYTNQGNAPGEVTITDTLPRFVEFVSADNGGQLSDGTVTWTITVPAGESKTVSVKVKVIAPNAFIDNQATAIRDGHEVSSNIVTNHTYEEVGGKDVALAEKPAISIDGQMVQVGQELVYTIHYTNITNAPVDVTITDMVPQHTSYVQGSAVGATEEDNKLTWQFNGVQPREQIEVSFKVRVLDPGEQIANQAQIFDGTNKVTNRVVNSVPEKTVDKQEASAGETLTYTITYTNTTGAKADLVITDRLDAALEYVDGTAGIGIYENGTITWTVSGVENGDTVEVSFQAKVKTDAVGQVTNSATVIENTVNVVPTNGTVTEVLKPDLVIEKAQAVGTDAPTTEKLEVTGGKVVTYYITVTNHGEGAANGVQVADKIPEGLVYVEGSASNGGTVENGIVSWNLGTVEADGQVTVTFQVKVPKLKENTSWTNVAATVYENDPDGDEPIGSNEVVVELKVPTNHETGDTSNPALFLSIMILSGFGLTAMMIFRRREEETEEA